MRPASLPVLGVRYWAAICAASVFGAALGDFISHPLHLGHWRGVPLLAVAFGLILLLERRAAVGSTAFYWLAVVVVRAAATNIADLASHDLHLPEEPLIGALLVLMVLFGSFGAASRCATSATRPDGNGAYWAALFVAGTLGTVLGDDASHHWGVGMASLLLSGVLVLLLLFRGRVSGKGSYWLAMIGARSAGTSVGDFLADPDGLGLGIPAATAGSGLVMLSLLLGAGRLGVRTTRAAGVDGAAAPLPSR